MKYSIIYIIPIIRQIKLNSKIYKNEKNGYNNLFTHQKYLNLAKIL